MADLELSIEVQSQQAEANLRALAEAEAKATTAAKDLDGAVSKGDKALKEYSSRLEGAQYQVRGLSDEQKASIDISRKLGDANRDIAQKVGISTDALRLYIQQEKEAEKATKDVTAATQTASKVTDDLGVSHGKTTDKTKGSKSATDELKSSILGLVSAGVFMAAIKAASDYASNLKTMSAASGLSLTALQKMDAAARGNGSEIQKVVGAYGTFQDRLVGGDKSVTGALGKLGISLDDLRTKSPDEQMRILAQAVSGIEDPTLKANVATDLFGGSGRALIPTLADISARYDDLPAQSDAVINSSAALSDTWVNLQNTGTVLLMQILAPLSDAFAATGVSASGLTSIIPSLQLEFQGFYLEVTKLVKALMDAAIRTWEVAQSIPGLATVLGGTTARLQEAREASVWLGDTIKGMDADIKNAIETQKVHTEVSVKQAGATKSVAERLAEAKKELAALSPENKKAITDSKSMGDSLKEQAAAGHTTVEVVKLLSENTKEHAKQQREAAKATKDHERELAKLAENKAGTAMALLAKDVEAAYNRGLTAKEIYDSFGKRLLDAGKDAQTFRIDLEKLYPILNATVESAQGFKVAEFLAKANQEAQKELGRIIKEQTALTKQHADEQTRIQVDANNAVLKNYEELNDAKATLRMTDQQKTVYELDQWRRKEHDGIKATGDDYVILSNQIEEIYAVKLAKIQHDWLVGHGLTWDKAKQAALDSIENVKGAFAGAMAGFLTGATGFKDAWGTIWDSIKQSATNILKEILEYYLNKFIVGLLTGMGSGGTGVTGAILQAAQGGGSGATGGNSYAGIISKLLGGGGGTIAGTTSLAGTAALAPGLASTTALSGTLASTSLAGSTTLAPGLTSASTSGLGGVGGAGIGGALAGGAAAGGAGLGLGLLGTKIFGGSGWKASGFGAAAGAGAGALIGTFVFPGIGTALGAGIGAIGGAIGGWIGKSVGEKINDSRDEFLAQFGKPGTGEGSGFANVNADLARMDKLGMDGTEARRLIFNPKDWDDFNAGVQRLQAAFEDLRFVQDKVNEGFGTLQTQEAAAVAAGMTHEEAIRAQSTGYSELYDTIVRTGAEAPAGLEPILQSLIDMGALVDASGAKVENLNGLYERNAQNIVKNTKDVGTAFIGLQDQQQQLIDQGVAQEDVTRIQTNAYSDLYQMIQSTGQQAPAALQPIFQSMVDLGTLVDASGAKVTDLAGVFTDTSTISTNGTQVMAKGLADVLTGLDEATRAAVENSTAWQDVVARGGVVGPAIRDSLRLAVTEAGLTVDGIENAFRNFDPPTLTIPTRYGEPEPFGGADGAATGGYVRQYGIQYLAGGGLVSFRPRGSDTVPAMLTPGEGILSRRGMRALAELNRGESGGGDRIVIEKGAIVVNGASDPDAVADAIVRKISLKRKLRRAS